MAHDPLDAWNPQNVSEEGEFLKQLSSEAAARLIEILKEKANKEELSNFVFQIEAVEKSINKKFAAFEANFFEINRFS